MKRILAAAVAFVALCGADAPPSVTPPDELVTWPDLDHQLDDSDARASMLRKSDAFLRASMGM